jgi:UDP-N-acetylmuramoyl-L-alanyl-D-glutamate--2,6-diaminopimelate ligase
MKLADLLTADAVSDARLAALEVGGVSADSRSIKPGDLFVAVAGARADGLEFLPQALAAGAAAVMAERPPPVPLPPSVPFIKVDDARRVLARAAATLFPCQPQVIAAVTGTSGKTSVAAFTRQIWTALGHASASIGTVGLVSPQREVYGSLTTPDPVALHRSLDQLAREGVTHLAIEASSHGLDQRRLDGVHVAAGGFTNLSRDHLDYHPTLEAYLAAKLRLFEHLIEPGGAAVIAADHEHADAVMAAARRRDLRLVSVGRRGESIRLIESRIEGFAQALALEHDGRTYRVRLPLPGDFQVDNALVAAGLVIATGGEPSATLAALAHLEGAKGRLELVGERNGAPIFVDYAHAAKLADRVVVTDDNPRSENPAAIRAAILAAAPGALEIGDRREAIRTSISGLRRGDVLLIAGKGHETGQIIGKQVLPFSDHEAVAAALAGRVA